MAYYAVLAARGFLHPDELAGWVPLVMDGRDPAQVVAATRAVSGTDVNFGALTRLLLAQAEERGTLELEEADGVHVIDAPKDSSDKAIASSDHVKGGPAAKNVTIEEVPEEPAISNAAAT